MTTGKYFNRGVMALDSPYIGHVVRETPPLSTPKPNLCSKLVQNCWMYS